MANQLLVHLVVAATAIWLIGRILYHAERRTVVVRPRAGLAKWHSPRDLSKRICVRMGIVLKRLEFAQIYGWNADEDSLLMDTVDDELQRLAEETQAREKVSR